MLLCSEAMANMSNTGAPIVLGYRRQVSSKFRHKPPLLTPHRALTRQVTTQKTASSSDGYEILAAQRLKRPVSPHLSIYKPQITWYASALNRISGSILSGGFYLFFAAYAVAPLLGWHLESVSLAAAFGALPLAAKLGLKFTAALPFTFHSLNGVRHLVWDMGKQIRNQQVARSGWLVVGLSLVGAAGLALM